MVQTRGYGPSCPLCEPADVLQTPAPGLIDMQDHMHMVAHHGVGTDIQGKHGGEFEQAGFNPGSSVRKVLAGQWITAAQKGAADTAADTVIVRRRLNGDLGFPGPGHRHSLF